MHAHIKALEMVRNGLKPQVTFLPRCEDLESYPEAGMKGRIIEASLQDEGVIKVMVDFEPYSEHNKGFESSNYYDKNGNATLTARQAGWYQEVGALYLSEDGDEYFVIDSEGQVQLFEQYAQSGYQGTYTAWLEEKLLRCGKAAEDKYLPSV